MKHTILTAAFVCTLAVTPLWASGLSDPVVTADVVAAEAERDASKDDGLIVMIWLMTLAAAAGGAF